MNAPPVRYATHAIAAAKSPVVALPSHQIKLVFQTVWPQVVTCIENEAVDEAHGKLSWYQDQYKEATKSIKALKEKLSSEKDRRHKVEAKQSKLEAELKNLQKRLSCWGSIKPLQCHANDMNGSPTLTLTLLSNHSANPQGSDGDTITQLLSSQPGEWFYSQTLLLWTVAHGISYH